MIFDAKKLSILFLAGLIAIAGVGCGKSHDGEFMVYYINENGTGLYPVSVRVAKSGETDYMIRDMLDRLSGVIEDQDYYAPITGKLTVESYTLSKKRLTVVFSQEYRELSPTAEALLRASVVQTMLGIEGVDEVSFYVGDDPVTDTLGVPIGPMTADSFIYDYGQAQQQSEQTELTLYYAAADGNSLYEVTRHVHYSISQPLEQVVMQYLSETPGDDSLMSAIPEGTNVLSVVTSDGTCYLTLDSNFLNLPEGESRDVAIYSIVNSLCALDSIDRVQIIIEGSAVGGDNVSGTYKRNDELILPVEQEE